MTEVYTVIYQMVILTEDCEKWDKRNNVDKKWGNFQSHFTDAHQKMHRSQKQTAKHTVSHGANAVLTDELERSNYALISMAQMSMTDKEHTATITWTVAEFTR